MAALIATAGCASERVGAQWHGRGLLGEPSGTIEPVHNAVALAEQTVKKRCQVAVTASSVLTSAD